MIALFSGFILITFLLPKGVLAGPPSSGDWIVSGTESYRDQSIVLNGSLIIENSGNLTFLNVTLKLNCAYDGQYGIRVNPGGSFYVLEGSVITAVDPSNEYSFRVEKNSTFRMNHSELHECGWTGWGDRGFQISSNDAIVENSLISNNFVGILCDASSPIIRNNNISSNANHAIWLGNSRATIEGNHLENNGNDAIYMWNSSALIRANTIKGNPVGIRCSGYSNATISNNTIKNNDGCGIQCDHHSSPKILDNNISLNSPGIYCYEHADPLIQGNSIMNNYYGGIVSTGYSNLIIRGNIIRSNKGDGISSMNGSQADVHWNDIYSNDRFGVLNDDPGVVINATYNYWGEATGPAVTSNPDEMDPEEVSANVAYNPWLSEPIIVVGITYPLQGAMVSGVVTVAVDARAVKGISAVRFYLDSALMHTDYDSPYQWSWDTSYYADASYEIYAAAHGVLGGKRVAAVTVVVDNTLPEGNVISPKMSAYVSGACPISLFGGDANFEDMELYVNEDLMKTWYSGGDWTYNWNTSAYSDGEYAIKLMIWDKAGNNRTVSISVTVDNTAPSTEILTPTEGMFLTGKYNVTFTFYDANLFNATLKADGKIYDVTNDAWFLLNTTELTEGSRRITLIVVDKAGNRAEKEVTIILDHTSPILEIKSPADNAKLHGSATINWTVSDANLRWVRLIVEDFVYDVTAATSFQLNTTLLKDSNYTVMIMAIDGAGNYATASIRVLIDNTPPAVSIQNPADGATVSLRLIVAVEASDTSGVSKVDFYISDVLSYTVFEAPYRWEWDTTQYDNGEYIIRVVACDMGGVTSSEQITVTVRNVKVPWWQERALEIIGTIAAIGALIVAIIEHKRKH